jgi:hypothetical protein
MELEQVGRRYAMFGGVPRVRDDEDMNEREQEQRQAANWERAVRRAKQSIRWLCKQMAADRLFTLTYRANVEDREQVKADFKEFLRLVRKGGFNYRTKGGEIRRAPPQKGWKYVAVLERQDRGALHIHVAVKGWQRVEVLRAAWYRAASGLDGCRCCDGLESGADTPGAVNVTSPRDFGKNRRDWKTAALAGYITKYLSKTFNECCADKKRYWHSCDVTLPPKQGFFLASTNMLDAIKGALKYANGVYGLDVNSIMHWVSWGCDCYWLSGNCNDLIATGCPF